jgi:hypothetical protein
VAATGGVSATSVPIGARNCPVTIIQPVVVNGIQGWQVAGTDMVNLAASTGSESPNATLGPPDQVMSTVLMLYRPSLRMRPRMRLQYVDNGVTRTLEIDSVINVNQMNRVLQLQVREVTS